MINLCLKCIKNNQDLLILLKDHLQKNKERIQKSKETVDTSYIYKNELDKACFQHNMAYGDFKDLAKKTASVKVLGDKAINIAKSPKYDGYQRRLASVVYKYFDQKSTGSGVNIQVNNEHPLDLTEELHKPIIRKLKKERFIQGSKTIFGVLI